MARNLSPRVVAFLLFAGIVSLCGCGGDSPKLVPVSGQVTINGKAAKSGWVTFKPDKKSGNTFNGEPSGEINSSGKYTIQTNGKPGAPLGAYKVLVNLAPPTTEDNTKVKASTGNPTYMHPDTTPLKVEVVEKPAAGAYDFKVTP